MPLVGQADAEVDGAPSGVTEQMPAKVTPPPTSEQTELSPALVVPSVVGVAPQAEGPASPVEVATTAPRQEQPDAVTVVSEGAAQSMPPMTQATTPDAG